MTLKATQRWWKDDLESEYDEDGRTALKATRRWWYGDCEQRHDEDGRTALKLGMMISEGRSFDTAIRSLPTAIFSTNLQNMRQSRAGSWYQR